MPQGATIVGAPVDGTIDPDSRLVDYLVNVQVGSETATIVKTVEYTKSQNERKLDSLTATAADEYVQALPGSYAPIESELDLTKFTLSGAAAGEAVIIGAHYAGNTAVVSNAQIDATATGQLNLELNLTKGHIDAEALARVLAAMSATDLNAITSIKLTDVAQGTGHTAITVPLTLTDHSPKAIAAVIMAAVSGLTAGATND